MKKTDFYFDLPKELIAQTPLDQRDQSKMMHINKNTGAVEHRHFYELPEMLQEGDCLVLNDSRVLPARLIGTRPTGGNVEVLLLHDLGDSKWECLTKPGKKTRTGTEISFGDKKNCRIPNDIRPSIPENWGVLLHPQRVFILPMKYWKKSREKVFKSLTLLCMSVLEPFVR